MPAWRYTDAEIDWDTKFEGEIVSLRGAFEHKNKVTDAAYRAHDKRPEDDIRYSLDVRCRRLVIKGRKSGLSDKVMRKMINTNLTVYGFDASTFPIDLWMA